MFTGDEGTIIDKQTATAMTEAYREAHGTNFKAQFFGKDKIKEIISDCGSEYVGFRIYNAIDDTGKQGFVLVGVKADENDLYDNKMLAAGPTCPSCCATASPLN